MSEKVVGLIRTGGVALLFIIGVILILGSMSTEVDPETGEAVGDVSSVINSVNFSLYLIYGCLGAIIVFTVWSIVQNPKRFIPSLIGVAVFAIIALIGYSMASAEIIPDLAKHPDATAKAHKMGGAGILTTYILVIVAVVLIVAGSVIGALRYFAKS